MIHLLATLVVCGAVAMALPALLWAALEVVFMAICLPVLALVGVAKCVGVTLNWLKVKDVILLAYLTVMAYIGLVIVKLIGEQEN